MNHTKGTHRKSRSKFLTARARSAYARTQTGLTSTFCQLPDPILSRTHLLPPKHQTALLRARYLHAFPQTTNCKFCEFNEPHTVTHATWRCTYPPLAHRRMATDIGSPDQLELILDARSPNHTTPPNLNLTNILNLLSWSPVFHPRA